MDNSKPEKKRGFLIEEGGEKKFIDLIVVNSIEELEDIEGQWDELDTMQKAAQE